MTQTICVSHPHAASKWTLTPLPSTHTANTYTAGRKCLHMQETKNSLGSSIKNRPEKIKAGFVGLSVNALTVCLSAFGYLWRMQAGRQAERGEALEMKRRASCTAVLLPLQLASQLIRMGESMHGGGGESPQRFELHAPVVRNAALCFSQLALQNSAVWIIRCGMLGNRLLYSLWNILGHLTCRLELFAWTLCWTLLPTAISLTQCNTVNC